MTDDEIISTPKEVFEQHRDEIANASSKEEALAASEPVLATLALYNRMDVRPAGTVSPLPRDISAITPLTEEEVIEELTELVWDLVGELSEASDHD